MDDGTTGRVQQYGYRKPRFPVDFHFLVQPDRGHSQLLNARCIDISEDGLAAQIPDPLEAGARVTLILTLPGAVTSMRLAAIVNYCTDQCSGFKFVFSSDEERDFICRYLATLRSAAISIRPPAE
jgi:hypothetical protein